MWIESGGNRGKICTTEHGTWKYKKEWNIVRMMKLCELKDVYTVRSHEHIGPKIRDGHEVTKSTENTDLLADMQQL